MTTPSTPLPVGAAAGIDAQRRAAREDLFAMPRPAPDLPPQPSLADLMEDHGPSWQITFDDDAGVWVAVKRPTPTAQHILVAHTAWRSSSPLSLPNAPLTAWARAGLVRPVRALPDVR